ncbi:MAG: 50S ribosomal protein L13 [Fimbriimonadaceae bacterium]|nr:50S ribosomal protein L13 [Fimbriimonadaceae bacterium]
MNRTYTNKGEYTDRKWYVVDAAGIPIGRLAGQVAQVLRGKGKPNFQYNMDAGDFVVIINADKVALTGNKRDELIYWHTGWPGGLRNVSRGKMLENDPVKLVEKAVWGMTPKTKLGKQIFKKLKVYAGPDHPHEAQQPEVLNVRQESKTKKAEANPVEETN